MPTLTAATIRRIGERLLRDVGALDENATTVATHLADANLAGHDSHGFIRIPKYLSLVSEGLIKPESRPEVARDHLATAQVNGNGAFGQVAATFATKLAIEKARQYGVGLATIYNLGHTGRLGTYPEMVAREGMAAIMTCGGIGPTGTVAPFGGREGRLGTNPISMAFPFETDAPILQDFATSITAEGKLQIYRARGQTLPDDWVIDKDGVASRDPNDFYDGGAILPIGGLTGGHKGYALSFMVTLLGGILGWAGVPQADGAQPNTGCSITVIDAEAMGGKERLRAQVEDMVRYVKSSPALEGFSGVLYPGEIEAQTRRDRLTNGVPIEDATWDQVAETIRERGLEKELAPLP